MNDQEKTRDELLKELLELKQSHDSLKETFNKEITRLQQEKKMLEIKMINFKTVFDSSPAAMLIIDERSNIQMVNDAAKKLIGGNEAAILNQRTGTVLQCIHSTTDPRGCGYSNACIFCEIRDNIENLMTNGGFIHGSELKMTLIRNGKPELVWLNIGVESILLEGKKHWCIALEEITQRKQAEESLKEAQILLRSSIESMKDTIIFSINKQYNYLYFNNLHKYVMHNSSGCDIELGMNMIDCLINEGDRIKIKNNFDRALEGESHTTIEEYGHIDRYYYETRYNPIINDQDEIIGATAFSYNITIRKRAEQALLESEQRWRKLVQTIPDFVALYDQEGKYLFLNRFSEGFSMKDIDGKCYSEFLAEESQVPYREAFTNAQKTKTTQYIEYVAMGDNRKMRHYESYFIPIHENDQFENMMVIARDITDRIEAANKIKESEANARAIMESTDDIIALIDKQGVVIDCNEAHARRVGMSRKELLGKNIFSMLPNDIGESRRQKINEVIETGKPVSGEDYRGGYWNEFVIQPIFVENKITDRVAVFARDITQRKKTEEFIKINEAIFNQFLENSPIYVFFKDENIRTLRLSRNYEKMLGKSLDELMGKTMDDLFPSDLAKNMIKNDLQILKEGVKVEVEEELNGRYYSTIKFPIQIEGKSKFLAGFTIDLTERIQAENALKESEELNRLFFENSGEAILYTQPDGRITYANQEACRIFGRTKEELCQLGRKEVMDPNDSRLAPALEERKRTGKFKGELNMVRKDGTIFPVEISSTIFMDSKGNQNTSIIINDITERKKAEQTLKENDARLTELIATKDKFFSIIAHDLRSPFNSFLGLTQFMAENLQSLTMSQLQDIAVSMSKSATNLYRLMNNLLKWAQIQQGKIQFDPHPVSLNSIVDESIEMIQESATVKNIEITNHIPDNTMVFADNNMLEIIVRNLISNAVKFTHKGGRVSLMAQNLDHAIEISVKDSGIGMSQEMINNLFKIDVHTNRMGTEGELSTGLGLVLCKEFIEKHGGQLWVESEVKKGSTFYFNLPNQPDKAEELS